MGSFQRAPCHPSTQQPFFSFPSRPLPLSPGPLPAQQEEGQLQWTLPGFCSCSPVTPPDKPPSVSGVRIWLAKWQEDDVGEPPVCDMGDGLPCAGIFPGPQEDLSLLQGQ